MKHLAPIPLVKIIFALVVFLMGAYILIAQSGIFYGLLFIAAGLRLSMRQGIEIDLEKKRYRHLSSIFAIDFGSWQDIPNIEYISVFRTKQKNRLRFFVAQALTEKEVFKLNLFHSTNKHIEAYVTETIEDAFEVANHMAMALDTEVYDATKE